MDIQGVAALVTGGASGLGAATARRLASGGAEVTLLDKNADAGEALAKELGGGAKFVSCDVTDADQVSEAVAMAGESAPLRVAVNCAGLDAPMRTITGDGSPHDFDVFKFVVSVNLIGTFNVIRLAASSMSKTEPLASGERGAIVNTASVAAFDGQIGQVAYSASKGGIVGMTLPIARDLSRFGIRVNTIAPGLIDTPIYGTGDKAEAFKAHLGESVLFPKRLGDGEELASMVIELITNPYMNGEVVRVDGGIRLPPR